MLDKNASHKIELFRRQWSGNEKAVIKGIGVVTCVDVNPATDQFLLIDFRLDAPDGDGKTKLDHIRDRLTKGCCPEAAGVPSSADGQLVCH